MMPGCSDEPVYFQSLLSRLQFRRRECRRRTPYHTHEFKLLLANLLRRFPDVHDGWDRLGMVHEARGDSRQAADCYRKVIAFIRDHPDDYEPGFEEVFVKLVDRLDPPTAN